MTFGPYPAQVLTVHDGDTARLDIDLGFGIHAQGFSCRMFGINAPELSTAAGKAALAFAETLLEPGMRVSVVSHGFDKFGGRFDGEILLPDGRDFASVMLAGGYAVPFKA